MPVQRVSIELHRAIICQWDITDRIWSNAQSKRCLGESTSRAWHDRRRTGRGRRHPLRRQLRRQAGHEPGHRREQPVRGCPGPVPAPGDDSPGNSRRAACPRRARVGHLHRQRRNRGLARRGPAAAYRGARRGLHVRAAGHPAFPGEPQRRHDGGRGGAHRPPGAGERGPHEPAAPPRRVERLPRRQPVTAVPREPPGRGAASRRTRRGAGTRRPDSCRRRPGRYAAPAASTWPGGPRRPGRPPPRLRTGASTPPR